MLAADSADSIDCAAFLADGHSPAAPVIVPTETLITWRVVTCLTFRLGFDTPV